MTPITRALQDLEHAVRTLLEENSALRDHVQRIVEHAGSVLRGGARSRPARASRPRDGGPRKRGRAFKFTDEQAVDFRKQIEGGKSAAALARELKVSLPTMYSTLKRGGWRGRR